MITVAEIILLKYPDINPLVDVVLQDDGAGPYIKEWNLETPKPTKKDLDKWAEEFDLAYRQQQAKLAREYPPIEKQLDMQYWDSVNGTTVWQDTIAAIKEASPIPQE